MISFVPKIRNNGKWSEARFKSFIKGALRAATRRWGPIHQARKDAWVRRGVYKCVGYKRRWHHTRWRDGVFVDHIHPVIGPEGFTTWDLVIENMFVEIDKLQVLCKDCHDRKTKDERQKRK